jgi:hypothetical protein
MATNKTNRHIPAKLDLSRLDQIKIEHDVYTYLNSQFLEQSSIESELLDLDESLSDKKLGKLIREQIKFFRDRSQMVSLNDSKFTVISQLSFNKYKTLLRITHEATGIELVKKV